MHTSLTTVVFLASSIVVAAQQPAQPNTPQPPKPNPKGGVVQFTVSIEPEALKLEREFLENQLTITHVQLQPASGEPVFYTDAPGFPRLPRLARFVALPPGATVESIEFEVTKSTLVDGVPLVGWASLAQPGQFNDNPNDPTNRYDSPPEFLLDASKRPVFYPAAPAPPDPAIAQLKTYPERSAGAVGLTPHGAVANVLRLDVAPVQWHIQAAQLRLATEIQIAVQLEGGKRFPLPKTPGEGNLFDDLRDMVVNPGDLPVFFFEPRPIDVPYLIITDDSFWTPDFVRTPGANLVDAFEPLARWKTEKGVRAAVVRLSDIVDGRYGDFRTGAADLQETIRNFLKHTEARYGTQWVLLGGDIDIVPVRKVVVWGHANAAHYLLLAEDIQPKPGRANWDAGRGTVVLNTPATGFTHILSTRTGRSFTQVASPGVTNPGWHVLPATKCDMTGAPEGSRCLEVGGPLADIENTNVALVLGENTIPTDLYYASLRGPEYDRRGLRDWDANGDGLYGTNLWDRSADGVSYAPTVRLGRAGVGSAGEARAFVTKVINYERYLLEDRFASRLLLGADNWGDGPGARPTETDPPEEGRFLLGTDSSVIHFASAPAPASDWRLVSWRRADSWTVFDYTRHAAPGVDGYYYCTDAACTARSEIFFSLGVLGTYEIPIPTKFVKVFGPSGTLRPAFFFFDHRSQDGSVQEKEQVKNLFTSLFPAFADRQRHYKDVYDIAPAPDLQRLTTASMRTALDDGFNVTSLSGHGWFGGCCGLDRDYVDELVNPAGIIYADSCLTNEFDQSDAVSELLLSQSGGGAVGYVGNTRFSWIGQGAGFERAFWGRMRNARHLGVLHDTKARFVSNPSEQWTNFSLNLQGDPELEVWRRGAPARMTLTVPTEVFQGMRIQGQVLSAGAAVPLARVTLIGDGVHQTVTADLAGRFRFNPDGRVGQTLKVTATHTLLELRPVSRDVRVERFEWTGPLPPVPPRPLPGR